MLKTSQDKAIGEVLERWVQALRDKDTDAVRACHTDDFVHFSLAPPLVADRERRFLQSWFDTWEGPIQYSLRDVVIEADENLAFTHSLNHLSGTQDGKKVDTWFRETKGLRMVNGQWKIAHEHQSVPFAMDGSFKALVNLRPSA